VAWAAPHLHLEASYPAADDALSAAPDTVRLWFNEEPELSLAAIGIESAQGQVEVGDVEATDDPKSVRARVVSMLAPGEYRVTWRAAGSDGHVVRGSYAFSVATDAQGPGGGPSSAERDRDGP
jgi:methionine-rich copper-binding protein CopC